MPSCPECGIDVAEEGLCSECKSKKERGKKKGILPVLLLTGSIVIFGGAFLLGRITVGTNQTDNEGNNSLSSETNVALTEGSQNEAKVPSAIKFDVRNIPTGPPYENLGEYLAWMLENTDQTEDFLRSKWTRYLWIMSWSHLPGLTHARALQAFLRTPREYFCREWNKDRAYDHAYLDIGWGQTISGPEIVTRMTNAINPQPDHKVLEIGTGSGYQAAYLSELSNHVYTIEIIEDLADVTDNILSSLVDRYPQYSNITRKADDGYYGWEEYAPFDRIIVTCGIDHIPPPLLKQLVDDGIMVIPVGPPSGQTILKITKRVEEDGTVILDREDIYEGTTITTDIFVPFRNKEGRSHTSSDS